jgi:thioredoxin-like negative regulator of GroEL
MYPHWFLVHDSYTSMEEAAEANCDALIARALSIAPDNPEARLSLASIRMSQQRFEEAKEVIVKLYQDIEGLDSCRYLCLRRERRG